MTKIITFAWVDSKIFEKHGCEIKHNEEIEVPDASAIDMALAQAKVILESGLNVMVSRYPGKKIIWVAADDKKFTQR